MGTTRWLALRVTHQLKAPRYFPLSYCYQQLKGHVLNPVPALQVSCKLTGLQGGSLHRYVIM